MTHVSACSKLVSRGFIAQGMLTCACQIANRRHGWRGRRTDPTVLTVPSSEGAETCFAELVSRLDWVLSMCVCLLVCLSVVGRMRRRWKMGAPSLCVWFGMRMRHAQEGAAVRRVQRPKLKGSRQHVRYQKISLAGQVMCRGLQIMCARVLFGLSTSKESEAPGAGRFPSSRIK